MMGLLRGFASKVEDMANGDMAADIEELKQILPKLTDFEWADQLADEMGETTFILQAAIHYSNAACFVSRRLVASQYALEKKW
ncbi:unnamed protein product, partial [Cylicostephanus goldi]